MDKQYIDVDIQIIRDQIALSKLTDKERISFKLIQSAAELLFDSDMPRINDIQFSFVQILETMKSDAMKRNE